MDTSDNSMGQNRPFLTDESLDGVSSVTEGGENRNMKNEEDSLAEGNFSFK